MNTLKTVSDVVAALGGRAAVAAAFDCTHAAVGNWMHANKLPAHTYVAVYSRLRARGAIAPVALWNFSVAHWGARV